MLLRNGSIYIPIIDKKRVKPKITIFTSNCLICSLDYKPGDCITSCNRVNISRHSFHINCLFSVKNPKLTSKLFILIKGKLISPNSDLTTPTFVFLLFS